MKVRDSLKRGTVELVLLTLLENEDMYGYQMLQEAQIRSGGCFELKEGTAYPILYRLLDRGLISERAERAGRRRIRIYYHLEQIGRDYLEELKQEYMYVTEGIERILTGETDADILDD